MTETMEKYMSKTRGNYRSGVAKPKINDKTHFELKGQFLKKLRENTFSGSEHEDANKHIENVLDIVDLFHIPEEVILFYNGLYVPLDKSLTQKGAFPLDNAVGCKVRPSESDAKLSQGPHTTYKGLSTQKQEGKNRWKKLTYIQFGAPYQLEGQYKAQQGQDSTHNETTETLPKSEIKELLSKNLGNSRLDMHELLSINIRIEALIQLGYTVLDQEPYAVSDSQISNIFSETVPFPRRLHDYCCDEWKEVRELKILETYSIRTTLHDNTLPQKEKDPKSFTLPCFIHNVCFDKARVDLGASLIGEAVNESFDTHYGNYIELNDLDVPLEPRMDQDNNLEPTLDENIIVNEPTFKSCYKMEFYSMIGYKYVIADFLPTLSINMMTKRFYNSIIKDRGNHEGKKLAGTLIDIPIFVGKFSITSGFSIIDDMDVTSGVVLGMPFCKKFVSCQNIMEKFARWYECEQIDDE
ncbi:hypothetical protein Tco_1474200 [Tanacetum coccineum]